MPTQPPTPPKLPVPMPSQPPLSLTRRGASHLQCQKSHTGPTPSTLPWPETAHWRARRSSGRMHANAWWLPRGQHLCARILLRRAPTASRSTFLRHRRGYEDTQRCTTPLHPSHRSHKCMGVRTERHRCSPLWVFIIQHFIWCFLISCSMCNNSPLELNRFYFNSDTESQKLTTRAH